MKCEIHDVPLLEHKTHDTTNEEEFAEYICPVCSLTFDTAKQQLEKEFTGVSFPFLFDLAWELSREAGIESMLLRKRLRYWKERLITVRRRKTTNH